MKLTTDKGQIELPADFCFEVTQNSPAFSYEGTQSIATSLPSSTRNNDVLGFPIRMGRKEQYARRLPTVLEAGAYRKNAQLVIDSASKTEGFVGALMINESDLYSQIKEVTLPAIFADYVRDDFANATDKVASWYNHLYNCMKGSIVDDFTMFPVAVNYDETKGYDILNKPVHNSSLDPWGLEWEARSITLDGENVSVPSGYKITPFLWLSKVIEAIFVKYGYSVTSNPFKDSNSPLSKAVLINSTADAICTGKINYSDLVPSCTVADFLIFLESKFLMHAYINSDSKTVRIVPLETVLATAPDIDLSEQLNGEIKFLFCDVSEVCISSTTDLQGAKPAAETIFELGKKYTEVKKIDEATWRGYLWGNWPAWTHHLVQRVATGELYDIYFRRTGGGVPTNITLLGTNYFKYFANKHAAKEYAANDVMPPMVTVTTGLVGTSEVNILCPYIGESRNIRTIVEGEPDASEQAIIVVFAAGRAAAQALPAYNTIYAATVAAKYFLGTTQKYDNSGFQWATFDLTSNDLYKTFFKRWNNVLRNSDAEIECRIDFQDKQLFALEMNRVKMLKGQSVLIKSLTYSIGSKITHSSTSMALIKSLAALDEEDFMPLL